MWQKTFARPRPGGRALARGRVAHWKDEFPTFWPKGSTFYAPLAGITPGEVALLEVPPVPGSPVKMSTGVLVIYADRESFTFMTPEGHALSAWITFSAYRDGDDTVVQVQALERTSDPFIELIVHVRREPRQRPRSGSGRSRTSPPRSASRSRSSRRTEVCVDKRRQWKYAGNVRHSAAVHMAVGTVTAPARWVRRRRDAG